MHEAAKQHFQQRSRPRHDPSPRPWRVAGNGEWFGIEDADGRPVILTNQPTPVLVADALHIVRCVNHAHQKGLEP